MDSEKVLKNSINSIIELLKREDNEFTRLGLYMALSNIKNRIVIEDEELLEKFDLKQDLEKYL